jgi:hypothetical protein
MFLFSFGFFRDECLVDIIIFRDLCINRNNHQKPTFHPLGDFLNPALALLGQGLKKSPIRQKLGIDDLVIHIVGANNLFIGIDEDSSNKPILSTNDATIGTNASIDLLANV